ncbi:hypothetical protein CROQUDRAFT_89352 [Cronartium quercuum f. sp. fusiforme G11]|uniref:Uncharacterized protein n=1 Tax=Cronartium quercuum f. sp. fusiforme G11 TaxID=708437 RepID=A0A9P6NS79_9BASI|nr:hypothetical protein CROQUDRAFT_89352 [Cronartium quercuum f. sp. fusiforme G11]
MSSTSKEGRLDYEELPCSHPTLPSTPFPITNESETESKLSTTRAYSPPNTNMSSEPSIVIHGIPGRMRLVSD